jgi:hypothetical protein
VADCWRAEVAKVKAERDASIRERDEALSLACIGEHRYPDLTWKVRCAEVFESLRRTERERDELRARAARYAEALRDIGDCMGRACDDSRNLHRAVSLAKAALKGEE